MNSFFPVLLPCRRKAPTHHACPLVPRSPVLLSRSPPLPQPQLLPLCQLFAVYLQTHFKAPSSYSALLCKVLYNPCSSYPSLPDLCQFDTLRRPPPLAVHPRGSPALACLTVFAHPFWMVPVPSPSVMQCLSFRAGFGAIPRPQHH